MNEKALNWGTVLAAGAILFGFGTSIFFLPMAEYSEKENRKLANIAAPTAKNILDGSFSSSFSSFYKDRFPMKDSFVNLKATCEIGLLKLENNQIIFGKDGYLIPKNEYTDLGLYERNIESLEKICTEAENLNKPCGVAYAPRPIDVMRGALPKLYSQEDFVADRLSVGESVDLLPTLRKAAENGEYVWFRTDHHWTTEGAYLAYTELGKTLGYEPFSKEFFSIERVTDDFLGSSHSSSGVLSAKADSIDLYRYPTDGDYLVTITESGKTERGLYRTKHLSSKDKYSIFLGGNYAELSIRTETEGREKLLIFKDSYANSLVPFLALHYDLCLVDLRYFTGGSERISELIASSDRVLLLHGIDTLATTGIKI